MGLSISASFDIEIVIELYLKNFYKDKFIKLLPDNNIF